MSILPRSPAKRIILGRIITLVSAFIYCAYRATAAFLPDPDNMPTGALLLSGNGRYLWVWGAVWVLAGAWCIADLAKGHTRYGLAAAVGLALAWASAHLIVWAASGFSNPDWVPAIGAIAPCMIIFGLLLKVTALHDMVNKLASKDRSDGQAGADG